jgi:hypothetical protein
MGVCVVAGVALTMSARDLLRCEMNTRELRMTISMQLIP